MLIILVIILFSFSSVSLASSLELTTNKTHTSNIFPGTKFALTGYLYYSNNTSSSIKCDKLGFTLKNTGTVDINGAVFNAFNGHGLGNNNETTGDYYDDTSFSGVAPGELVLHTTPTWSYATGFSSVYQKYGNSAVFEMGAGPNVYLCASHQICSYPNLTFYTNP